MVWDNYKEEWRYKLYTNAIHQEDGSKAADLKYPGQIHIFLFKSDNISSEYPHITKIQFLMIMIIINYLTNSMAYGTRRFDAAFTRALQ